jgi:hypothetical protein
MAVIAACIFTYITYYPPLPPGNYEPQDSQHLAKVLAVVRIGYPLVGSVLIMLIITSPFALLRSVRSLRRLKAGRSGQTPRDGSVIAVDGPIIADHRVVTTPAGLTNCIAYEYNVGPELSRGLGDGYYYGYAFTPSSIKASFGKVKILAVPDLDLYGIGTTYKDSKALYNFKSYLRNTRFDKSIIGNLPFSKERNMSMTDRKSPVRADIKIKLKHPDPDLDGCKVKEKCLDEGEIVCAFGLYSASQQGLVHNPETSDFYSIQIKRGPITKYIREQKFSIVGNFFKTAFMLAMLAAMAWVYYNFYDIYDASQYLG